MPNQYDRILKENVAFLVPVIAKWRGVDMSNHEILKDKLQATLENEVDFCAKILHDDPNFNEIFHVEFHTQPVVGDFTMPFWVIYIICLCAKL